jgi:hypothetical protein
MSQGRGAESVGERAPRITALAAWHNRYFPLRVAPVRHNQCGSMALRMVV